MKKRILITLFAALLFSFSISAQILKGHVYDATTNEPLAGASVTYKLKDTQGVVTDINGAYEVHLPAGGVDLVIQLRGDMRMCQCPSSSAKETLCRKTCT